MSQDKDPQAEEIAVLSKDPENKDGDKPKPNGDIKGKGKEESDEPEIVRLLALLFPPLPIGTMDWVANVESSQSEEDLQLKTELEMLVERLKVSTPRILVLTLCQA